MRRPRLLLLLLLMGLASGCATVPKDPIALADYRANNDPLEPLNRRIFAFNLVVDRFLIKPMAEGYRQVLPEPGRNGMRRFLDNLGEPVTIANDLLQARWLDAGKTTARFAVNSTVGILGIRDPAAGMRLPRKKADFGQTLSRWGSHEGPYIIVPVVGPSNPRDLVGSGVDTYFDPFRYVSRANHYPTAVSAGRATMSGIDERSRNIESLDALRRDAVDYYASFRSLFRQNRAAELNPGPPTPPEVPGGLYDDPSLAAPSSAAPSLNVPARQPSSSEGSPEPERPPGAG